MKFRSWNLRLKYLEVELLACADYASVVVDDEAVVFISHCDVIKESRATESPDRGHVCSNGAVFHDLKIPRTVLNRNPHYPCQV